MADITAPVTLVSGAKIQNRGKTRSGERFYTRVECTYSGLVGNLSASVLGQTAVAEVIDIIRSNWLAGKKAGGDSFTMYKEEWTPADGITVNGKGSRGQRELRYRNQLALTQGAGEWKPLVRFVREGYPDRVVIPRGWQIRPEYVAATKLRYRTARVIHNTVDGIKTRNRVRFDGIPKWDAPAFAASGLMAVSLRGWPEKKRSYTLPKTEQRTMEVVVDVEAGFSLQVDPKRSGCAVNIAGLNASAMADLVTSANCPITDRLMAEIVEWQGHQDTLKKIIGYSRLAAQGMRWIGGL